MSVYKEYAVVLCMCCNCWFPLISLLATTSADSTIKIWTTADFSLRNVLKRTQEKWVWDCTFAQDSQHLFTGKTPHDNIVVH